MFRFIRFIPTFFFLSVFFVTAALCLKNTDGQLRLELIHRHELGPELGLSVSRIERVLELVRSDLLRTSFVSEMFGRRRGRMATEVPANATAFEMPISSGAYSGFGEYFVRLRVGTPAQPFLLVADTGSDLTWMNCRYRCKNCTRPTPAAGRKGHQRRVFIADASATFRPIQCSSSMCKSALPFSLTRCPTAVSPCAYDYGYADGSTAQGFFANESATVTLSTGQKVKFKNIVIGCTSASVGSIFRKADGVLGLGHSQHSFAVKATSRFGGHFSYCLVDHLSPKNATSYLTFGGPPASAGVIHPNCESAKRRTTYTNLIVEPRLEPFYAVEVTGISVGRTLLRIPQAVWNVSDEGGAIVDSGNSLTMLAEPAYKPLMAALSRPLRSLPRVQLKPFDFCFNSTIGYSEAMVPWLVVHFNGGARFKPPVKSYVIAAADGVKCIGFLSTSWPGVSTIGNILQQNFLWEFDLAKGKLGFMPSTCAL